MILEKDGKKVKLTDHVHIDCYKSKGWTEYVEKPKPMIKKEIKKETKKK